FRHNTKSSYSRFERHNQFNVFPSVNQAFHSPARGFVNPPELFMSTCGDMFARMLDTVPRGVQLTQVIRPLAVKPSGLELVLGGDVPKFSGEVWLWSMTANPDRTVRLLWDDHVGSTNNVSLLASGVSGATSGRYSAVWYQLNFTLDNISFLSVDADKGGLVQDGVVFSNSSCLTAKSMQGRLDVVTGVQRVEPRRACISYGSSLGPRPILDVLCSRKPTFPVVRVAHQIRILPTLYIWNANLKSEFATYNVDAKDCMECRARTA
ncbi:hypothetical protein C8J57DRAFT_1609315, partial [Mycena rebaudengoi]